MLMNDRMKTKYVLDFCNSFLKIDLNCVNRFKNRFKIMLIKYTCSFQRKMLLKGTLSGLRQFLATESPLKMKKNAFYFTTKALFVLKIFKFLSRFFGHVTKWLD